MSPAQTPTGGQGDVDSPLAGSFFRLDWGATFLLAWTVGVIDASTYERFGVFTSNQAGNLVLVATTIFSDASAATLPAESLLGAAVGVVLARRLGLLFDQRDGMRVLAPLMLATGLLIVTLILDLGNASLNLLIPAASSSLACLAAALLFMPNVTMWITANTGQLLTAVSGLLGPRQSSGTRRGLTRATCTAAIVLLGFVLGALWVGSGLLAEYAVLLGLLPAFAAIGMGAFEVIRRHRDGDAEGSVSR